jgi:hypothetical protein
VDVGNSDKWIKTPPCTWSAIPPPELRGEAFDDLNTNGGFVSFGILFFSNNNSINYFPTSQKLITQVLNSKRLIGLTYLNLSTDISTCETIHESLWK